MHRLCKTEVSERGIAYRIILYVADYEILRVSSFRCYYGPVHRDCKTAPELVERVATVQRQLSGKMLGW